MSAKNKKLIEDKIINFYEHPRAKEFLVDYPNPNKELNQMNTPFMAAIVAATGGFKTNFLINLLQRFDNTFSKIYVCNQEVEALYSLLEKVYKDGILVTQKMSDLPTFEQLGKDKTHQKLFIFDDLARTKNQDYIETMVKRGRKIGCSCIYISQSYIDIPIFIRKNLHYLFLLKIGTKRDLNLILNTYAIGIEPEQLFEIYRDAVKEKMNCFKIDVRTNEPNRRFCKNFTQFYEIE
jgi:hypothetical protein